MSLTFPFMIGHWNMPSTCAQDDCDSDSEDHTWAQVWDQCTRNSWKFHFICFISFAINSVLKNKKLFYIMFFLLAFYLIFQSSLWSHIAITWLLYSNPLFTLSFVRISFGLLTKHQILFEIIFFFHFFRLFRCPIDYMTVLYLSFKLRGLSSDHGIRDLNLESRLHFFSVFYFYCYFWVNVRDFSYHFCDSKLFFHQFLPQISLIFITNFFIRRGKSIKNEWFSTKRSHKD